MTRTQTVGALVLTCLWTALLPARAIAISANDSLTCLNKCPYFTEVYKGDASFRSAILLSLKRAEIPSLRWFPDGVEGQVVPIKIADKTYVTAYVCEPHYCGDHRIVLLYEPITKHLVGYYINERRTARRTFRIIGQPNTLETAWINGDK